ncbi:MAG: AbrB/MazE/SpoVT family DNA-binding domain-containing protein [Candidatus Methanoperedens sp.]|nr:AbrB/MazE/SpoVT family DNA-binding domain-containing protein [Candidatus Methanoperedens sp.]
METVVQLRKKGLVVIPEPVRIALNLKEGDIVQIDVKGDIKHEEYIGRRILTEDNADYVKKNPKENAIVTLHTGSVTYRLELPKEGGYGIEMVLKDANNEEIPEGSIIKLCKEKTISREIISSDDYEYRDLKRRVVLKKNISLLFDEQLALYVKDKNIKNSINAENIKFIVDIYEKQQDWY